MSYRFLFCAFICICVIFHKLKNIIMKTFKTEDATLKFVHLLQLEILVNMKFFKGAKLARKKEKSSCSRNSRN